MIHMFSHVQADVAQGLTMVEDTFLQQHLPHAHSLDAGMDARALQHLPVDQLCPHTALPGEDTGLHKSLEEADALCNEFITLIFFMLGGIYFIFYFTLDDLFLFGQETAKPNTGLQSI